jgi:hypothetical protein
LFENEKEFDDSRKDFESLLKKSPGYCPVFVQLRQEHKLADMDKAYMVDENSGILNVLQLEYGKDKVILRKKNQ